MPVTVVVGCQWGDEGKGKVIDALASEADWVARFHGGANAGHTLTVDGRTTVLHLVPSGILREGVRCAIGPGVVVDPASLLQEIDDLASQGVDVEGRLFVSLQAHCVTPMHRWTEHLSGADASLGTTRRGIGPAYEEKTARRGLRMETFLDPQRLRDGLATAWASFDRVRASQGVPWPDEAREGLDRLLRDYTGFAARLRPYLADVPGLLHEALDAGETILAEGAQGTLLDLDHGSYPYVTSSQATSGAACQGLGIPPRAIQRVVGVSKAYATRVGEGPFPTQMPEDLAAGFRARAREFGATTGRPRRCGWLDLVLLRRSLRLNGVQDLILTKLDVLKGLDPVRLCTSYDLHGKSISVSDASPLVLKEITPVYEEMEGWDEDISRSTRWDALAAPARAFVRRVAQALDLPIHSISVGPERQALLRVP